MKYTVVPHAHWDREWYFTDNKSILYLIHDLDEIIRVLEEKKDIRYFLLDAQTSLIEDYLKYRPENEERLKKLIKDKRILTGPWYTQTDQMIIHGESIVRNLLYGTEEAEEYGYCFPVGYCPDCFGMAAQMPQIYEGFGIKYAILKRGIDTSEIPYSEFTWESDDGSKVTAYHAVDYMNFRDPSDDTNKNMETLQSIKERYDSRSLSKNVLLFNGFDQHPLREDIDQIVSGLKENGEDISIERPEVFMAEISERKDLPVYKGELTSGETSRVHKSIYSSRADLKTLNSKCENELIRIAEPLQALYVFNGGEDCRLFLKEQWKDMMRNAAHDSIGCCNSDEVNQKIKARFENVRNSLEEYEKLTYREIAEGIQAEDYSFQVYNYLPYERSEHVHTVLYSPYRDISLKDSNGNVTAVKVNFVDDVTKTFHGNYDFAYGLNSEYEKHYQDQNIYRLDVEMNLHVNAMGWNTYHLIQKQKEYKEDSVLQVSVSDNGDFTVFNTRDQRVYHNFIEIEDMADAGDSYNWSSYDHDWRIVSKAASVKTEGNTFELQYDMHIPSDLNHRKNHELDAEMKLTMHGELDPLEPVIHFKAEVQNASTEHRVRVLVHTGISSNVSIADQTFGTIERPVSVNEEGWKEKGWNEKPCTIEPMQSYVLLKDSEHCVSVITDSVKEYQIIGDTYDTIAYTLFRSFPLMGKSNLPDRPGRESGMPWETPDANLYGKETYTFAVSFGNSIEQCAAYAERYCTPLRVHQEASSYSRLEFVLPKEEKNMPENFSLLNIGNNSTRMSILKLAEHDNSLILRTYQLAEGRTDLHFSSEIQECDLNEKHERKTDLETVHHKNEITTYKLRRK